MKNVHTIHMDFYSTPSSRSLPFLSRMLLLSVFLGIFSLAILSFSQYQSSASSRLSHSHNIHLPRPTPPADLEEWEGDIAHLFTHPLLAYPDIAFAADNPHRKAFLNDCITAGEFQRILQSLNDNDYILVSITDIFETKGDKAVKKPLYLPKNKKPLVLSFDDVNYYRKKQGCGMVDKIVLDAHGNLAASTRKSGKEVISYDNEFIPILETFVEKHPDFSHEGAKGTINLTGFDGVLGYRTQKGSFSRSSETAEAKKVIEKLKENGWTFASHSYGHHHMTKIDPAKLKTDVAKWKNEVQPLVGETEIYVYPYGEWEIYDSENKLTAKHRLLTENGFTFFCGVGVKNFFSHLPQSKDVPEKCLFMDRTPLDGYTITHRRDMLLDWFDSQDVVDSRRLK